MKYAFLLIAMVLSVNAWASNQFVFDVKQARDHAREYLQENVCQKLLTEAGVWFQDAVYIDIRNKMVFEASHVVFLVEPDASVALPADHVLAARFNLDGSGDLLLARGSIASHATTSRIYFHDPCVLLMNVVRLSPAQTQEYLQFKDWVKAKYAGVVTLKSASASATETYRVDDPLLSLALFGELKKRGLETFVNFEHEYLTGSSRIGNSLSYKAGNTIYLADGKSSKIVDLESLRKQAKYYVNAFQYSLMSQVMLPEVLKQPAKARRKGKSK